MTNPVLLSPVKEIVHNGVVEVGVTAYVVLRPRRAGLSVTPCYVVILEEEAKPITMVCCYSAAFYEKRKLILIYVTDEYGRF